jgi:YVTN family beta-propeller protein
MIYVANSQSNNLTVIDGGTNAVIATIPVGTSPSAVAVDSHTNFIYVANFGNSQGGNPGNITVIDGAKHTTTTLTDQNAVSPVALAANPVTNKIYVANSGSNNVTVIAGAHD